MESLDSSTKPTNAEVSPNRKRGGPSDEDAFPRSEDGLDYPKKRVSVACELCRVRKTKCDAKRPACSFCSQIGADCSYRRTLIPQLNRSDSELERTQYQDIISRLEGIERLLLSSQILYRNFSVTETPGQVSQIELATPSSAALSVDDKDHHHHGLSPGLIAGPSLKALSTIKGLSIPVVLLPLTYEDGEGYVNQENKQGEALFMNPGIGSESLDLNPRHCWRLQECFTQSVLPWCPIFDHERSVNLVSRMCDRQCRESDLETALALLILSLGAFSRNDHYTGDDVSEFGGIDYFQVACRIVSCDRTARYSLLPTQCRILMSLYFLLCLRPLQAFDAIHDASLAVLGLLQLKTRLEHDWEFRQSCLRAYWSCYLLEHELQSWVSYSACLLQSQNEFVPLPLSERDESGMYWFLSEIAFRKIFSHSRDGVGWSTYYTLSGQSVVDEVILQLQQWYSHLPTHIKFPLGVEPLLDPQKVFLRAQFYAINTTLHWAYIVRILATRPRDSIEQDKLLKGGSRCLDFATMHVFAVESLLQERHVMLFCNIFGLFSITMYLVCTYNVPALATTQHPSQLKAIKLAHRLLSIWAANPGVASHIARIESVILEKAIRLDYVTGEGTGDDTGEDTREETFSSRLGTIRNDETFSAT